MGFLELVLSFMDAHQGLSMYAGGGTVALVATFRLMPTVRALTVTCAQLVAHARSPFAAAPDELPPVLVAELNKARLDSAGRPAGESPRA